MNCDFSYNHYIEIVQALAAGRRVTTFDQASDADEFLLLRHDIDYSVPKALRMAELEHEHGFAATYFVLLTSDLYNALDGTNTAALRQITALGHSIGLHVDVQLTSDFHLDTAAVVTEQVRVLNAVLNQPVRAIAAHNPGAIKETPAPATLYDAYSARFTNNTSYLSDSCMRWRRGCPHDGWPSGSVQLLTHPIWWGSGPATLKERVDEHFDAQEDRLGDVKSTYMGFYAELRP